MAGLSKYTDQDRAQVYLALDINDGNIKRTARETGMPIATVRDWKKKWAEEGVPDAVVAATETVTDEFVEKSIAVRNMLLDRMAELAPEAKSLREAAVAYGIIDDKVVRASGKPTSRTENITVGLPSPEEVRALLGGWMAGALSAQSQREADIIEVSAVEVEPAKALDAATS